MLDRGDMQEELRMAPWASDCNDSLCMLTWSCSQILRAVLAAIV